MNLEPEHSAVAFKRFLKESKSKKFHHSLECVKNACDTIEEMKGIINYSRIAQYTENHFGGPKKQTIMNSKTLRLYIDLRKQEYEYDLPKIKKRDSELVHQQYPCADLDLKTKAYIDQLRSRNMFLEKSMAHIQKELLQKTRSNPIDLYQSISHGAQDDLSMQLISHHQPKDEQIVISEKARSGIKKLLELAENPNSYLEFQTKNGEIIMVLEKGRSIETILFGDELSALKGLSCQF
ncbi:MAG: hypothetical protein PHI97_14825 [Desulfobulbus sp.]|nr:hypothetical protein [Desulfobulbus sp.]